MEEIKVIEAYDFPIKSIKGICADNRIILNMKAIKDSADYNCILAEEQGHYFTTHGDILDQTITVNIKKELVARRWAYRKLLPLDAFIKAFEERRLDKYELIEDLNVTEEFLEACIEYYKRRYGLGTNYKNYTLLFEPALQIIKWL